MKTALVKASFVLIGLLVLLCAQAAVVTASEISQVCDVQETLRMNNAGPGVVESLVVQVALLQDSEPYQDVVSVKITPSDYEIITDELGNRYACFEFRNVRRGEKIEILTEYEVKSTAISFALANCRGGALPANVKRYLEPFSLIESNDATIRGLAGRLSKGKRVPCEILSSIYDYVRTEIEYVANTADDKGALWALQNGKGDCTEFSCLLVALCRAAGVPARWVLGITYADNPEDLIHSWAEVYLHGIGWVSVDPTCGRFPTDRNTYLAGSTEDKIILTRGTDLSPLEGDFHYYYEWWWDERKASLDLEDWDWCVTPRFEATAFEDDFSDPESGWSATSDTEREFGYENGEYSMRVQQSDWLLWEWAPPLQFPADFTAEVEARSDYGVDPERAYGIVWGTRQGNQYLLHLDTTGHYKLSRKINDQWQSDPLSWRKHAAIQPGNSQNHIQVLVEGTSVKIVVNDKLLEQLAVPSLGPVRVGLFGCTYDRSDGRIYFDSFRCASPE